MISIDKQVCLNFLNTHHNIAYFYILRGFRSYFFFKKKKDSES